jgi:hypothetical protein
MAHWHALTKLWMHMEHTVPILDAATTDLRSQFQQFVLMICAEVETKELAREFQACQCRNAKKQQETVTAVVKGAKRQKVSHPPDASQEEPANCQSLLLFSTIAH